MINIYVQTKATTITDFPSVNFFTDKRPMNKFYFEMCKKDFDEWMEEYPDGLCDAHADFNFPPNSYSLLFLDFISPYEKIFMKKHNLRSSDFKDRCMVLPLCRNLNKADKMFREKYPTINPACYCGKQVKHTKYHLYPQFYSLLDDTGSCNLQNVLFMNTSLHSMMTKYKVSNDVKDAIKNNETFYLLYVVNKDLKNLIDYNFQSSVRLLSTDYNSVENIVNCMKKNQKCKKPKYDTTRKLYLLETSDTKYYIKQYN